MPDAFGFETPEEALARVRDGFAAQNAKIAGMGANATSGQRAGQALANIFGGSVRKALDTRTARKEERQRLMDTQGMSKEEAKEQAKLSVAPQFAEVRKATRLQEITSQGNTIVDALLDQGIPGDRARAVGMFEVAQRLTENGFDNEATQLRLTASELLQAQRVKEAELSNLEARTSASQASTQKTQTELAADDDTFIKVDDSGAIQDTTSMPITDPEGRQRLRDQGYINVGNSAFGIQFDRSAFAGAPKAVAESTQRTIIDGLSMLSSIDVLRSISDQTGFIEGPARNAMAKLGINLFDNEGFIDAAATRKKMRADIQALVKGIPSNYDAGIFEGMIPDPGAFRNERFYNAQLDVLEKATTDLVELTIAFHQGTDKPIPESVLNAAYAQGIRVDDVQPMSQDEVQNVIDNPSNNVFTAHQKQLEVQAELFKNSNQPLDTQEQRDQAEADISFFLEE
jgi:hypothetical protein